MSSSQKIDELRDEFLRLLAQLKSSLADQSNPGCVPPWDASRSAPLEVVDHILRIVLQIVELGKSAADNQVLDLKPVRRSQRVESKRKPPAKLNDEALQHGSEKPSDGGSSLVPFVTAIGSCLVPCDVYDALTQTSSSKRPGPRSKTRKAPQTDPSVALTSLLNPEVRLDSLLPASEADTSALAIVKSEPLSDSSDDAEDDSQSGSSDLSGSDNESVTSNAKRNKSLISRAMKRERVNRMAVESQDYKAVQRRFKEVTQHWLTGPDYRVAKIADLKPEQRRDLFLFYLQHKEHYPEMIIRERITEKYGINKYAVKRILDWGISGRSFERKKYSVSENTYRAKVIKENPAIVQDIIKYTKDNPFTFSCKGLARKFPGIPAPTINLILQRNGIKVLQPRDRRAMKLSLEGKEYTPYYKSPELSKYTRKRWADRLKRRAAGDMTDGRAARHKDPNWRNLKAELGIPDDQVVYDKESVRKYNMKKAIQQLEQQLEQQPDESAPEKDPPKRSLKPSRSKRPSRSKTSTRSTDEDSAAVLGISQQPGQPDWQLTFDPATGNLYNIPAAQSMVSSENQYQLQASAAATYSSTQYGVSAQNASSYPYHSSSY